MRPEIKRGGGGAVHGKGASDRAGRRLEIVTEMQQGGCDGERGRIVAAVGHRRPRMAHARRRIGLVEAASEEAQLQRPRQVAMRGGVVGIELQRLFEEADSDRGVFRHGRHEMRQCPQIEIVGVEARAVCAARVNLGAPNIGLDDSDDGRRDPVLQVEHVLERAVEPVGPKMRAGLRSINWAVMRSRAPALRTPPSST